MIDCLQSSIQGHEMAIIIALFWMVVMLTIIHIIRLFVFLGKETMRIVSGESKYPNEYENPNNFGSH
jgi:hypothetical protein